MKKVIFMVLLVFSLVLLGCAKNNSANEVTPLEQQAIAQDIENCNKLEIIHKEGVSAGNWITYPRDECLGGKASYWSKVEICNQINNSERRDGCYNKLAVQIQNPELCRGERDIRFKCMQWSVGNKI